MPSLSSTHSYVAYSLPSREHNPCFWLCIDHFCVYHSYFTSQFSCYLSIIPINKDSREWEESSNTATNTRGPHHVHHSDPPASHPDLLSSSPKARTNWWLYSLGIKNTNTNVNIILLIPYPLCCIIIFSHYITERGERKKENHRPIDKASLPSAKVTDTVLEC